MSMYLELLTFLMIIMIVDLVGTFAHHFYSEKEGDKGSNDVASLMKRLDCCSHGYYFFIVNFFGNHRFMIQAKNLHDLIHIGTKLNVSSTQTKKVGAPGIFAKTKDPKKDPDKYSYLWIFVTSESFC